MPIAKLLSIATAVPPFRIAQPVAKAAARAVFTHRAALFDRLAGTFDNANIDQRAMVAPIEWYQAPRGWQDRAELYVEATEALFTETATKAVADAGLTFADIDGVVFVSTTGIATPSIDARVAPKLGMRDDIQRVPIFGLGCAGGVTGLATAARLASASPGSNWLFVTVETCSISIRLDSIDPAGIVATALFGDGAAAAGVGRRAHRRPRRPGRRVAGPRPAPRRGAPPRAGGHTPGSLGDPRPGDDHRHLLHRAARAAAQRLRLGGPANGRSAPPRRYCRCGALGGLCGCLPRMGLERATTVRAAGPIRDAL